MRWWKTDSRSVSSVTRSSTGPAAASVPRWMTTRSSATAATSVSRWLERKTVAAGVREGAEEAPHLADAVRVEAVERLVEDEDRRVPDEGRGQGEPLAHPEREAADPPIGRVPETEALEELLGRRCRHAGLHRGEADVVAGGPVGVEALVEDRPDDAGRVRQVGVADAVDRRRPARRVGEAEHDPHARRLARAVDAEEGGDAAGEGRGGEAVEDGHRAVVLGELVERKGWHRAELLCRAGLADTNDPAQTGPPSSAVRPNLHVRPRVGRSVAGARHPPPGVRPKADPAAADGAYCSGMDMPLAPADAAGRPAGLRRGRRRRPLRAARPCTFGASVRPGSGPWTPGRGCSACCSPRRMPCTAGCRGWRSAVTLGALVAFSLLHYAPYPGLQRLRAALRHHPPRHAA